MKNRIYIFLLLIGLFPALTAHVTAGRIYRDSCYSVGVSIGYGYNIVYNHHGVYDVGVFLPVNQHFEGEINLHATTANTYSVGFRAQPKFPINGNGKDYGEILLETNILYQLYLRNYIHGLAISFSAGYRRDYIYLKFGYGMSLASTMRMSHHSTENAILEPHNFIYHLEVFVRPHISPWNISLCVTDMTEYQMERMFTPVFILNSYVNLTDHWRFRMSVACKPVGIANMAPSFFGAQGCVGAEYRF